jgi:hypothetical protein
MQWLPYLNGQYPMPTHYLWPLHCLGTEQSQQKLGVEGENGWWRSLDHDDGNKKGTCKTWRGSQWLNLTTITIGMGHNKNTSSSILFALIFAIISGGGGWQMRSTQQWVSHSCLYCQPRRWWVWRCHGWFLYFWEGQNLKGRCKNNKNKKRYG